MLIGLTGGIGSGKSTVAHLLRAHGAVVIDADEIARAVVEPGTPALAAIVERFGAQMLRADGSLDRGALAGVVFADEAARRDLEAITHPAIGAEFQRRLQSVPSDSIVVYDVPLLSESSQHTPGRFDAVVVVEAPLELRLERLEQRGMPRDDAWARIANQDSDDVRRRIATHVVHNDGDLAALAARVDQLWSELQPGERTGS